jgi:hypothetical protein
VWIIVLIAILLGGGARPGVAQEAPRTGGILKAAMIGEPPTLDTPPRRPPSPTRSPGT